MPSRSWKPNLFLSAFQSLRQSTLINTIVTNEQSWKPQLATAGHVTATLLAIFSPGVIAKWVLRPRLLLGRCAPRWVGSAGGDTENFPRGGQRRAKKKQLKLGGDYCRLSCANEPLWIASEGSWLLFVYQKKYKSGCNLNLKSAQLSMSLFDTVLVLVFSHSKSVLFLRHHPAPRLYFNWSSTHIP